MRKITLFYDGTWYTFKWLKAILWVKKELRELGYDVAFLNEEEYVESKNKLETFEKNILNHEYDMVLLANHSSHVGLCSIGYDAFADLMCKLRKHCNRIIWCDTADSTGTIWRPAFSFCDVYFKKQVLSNLNLYTKAMYGGRIYTQYFYENGYINDKDVGFFTAITEEDLGKVRISWNVGLAELFEKREISYQKPYDIFTPDFVRPDEKRNYDIQYRGSLDYSVCGYQRLKSVEFVNKSYFKHPDVSKKIPYEEYIQEIMQSKTVISPYGYGEICTRDFEAFLYGAALLKPDMDHVVTYPNWYKKDETYVSLKWNLSDFDEVIRSVIESGRYMEIAENAQSLFEYYRRTGIAKEEFAKHIVQELEK